MTVITKSFDDAVYKLVPRKLPPNIGAFSIGSRDHDVEWAALLKEIPADLPGVVTHSEEPVAVADAAVAGQVKLLTIIASVYAGLGAYHDLPELWLDVLAGPESATEEQIAALLPYRPDQSK
jgi:hypothetical protein